MTIGIGNVLGDDRCHNIPHGLHHNFENQNYGSCVGGLTAFCFGLRPTAPVVVPKKSMNECLIKCSSFLKVTIYKDDIGSTTIVQYSPLISRTEYFDASVWNFVCFTEAAFSL